MGKVSGWKVAVFLRRLPELAASEFTARWLETTPAPTGAGLLDHVHNAPVGRDAPIKNAPPAPYDGVDEYLFTSAEQANAFFGSDEFREQWLAPRRGLLAVGPVALAGLAHVAWNRADAVVTVPVKILTLPVRREGMEMADFADYWLNRHFPLAVSGPGTPNRLLRAVNCPAVGKAPDIFEPARFDGIGNIVFNEPEALHAEFSSDHYREKLAPDEPRFTNPAASRAMMVEEFNLFRN